MADRLVFFKEIVQKDPENELARFSLANELCENGLYSEALEHYEFCLAKNPAWMRVCIQVGRCCLELGQRERALQSLNEARELMTRNGDLQNLQEVEDLLANLDQYGD